MGNVRCVSRVLGAQKFSYLHLDNSELPHHPESQAPSPAVIVVVQMIQLRGRGPARRSTSSLLSCGKWGMESTERIRVTYVTSRDATQTELG